MNESRIPTTAIEELTDALVAWAGMGEQMIQHMRRFAGHDPVPPIEVALENVLAGTIAPLTDRHAAADLAAAIRVLRDAIETVADEVLLVDP
jgi:hypothetical protein